MSSASSNKISNTSNTSNTRKKRGRNNNSASINSNLAATKSRKVTPPSLKNILSGKNPMHNPYTELIEPLVASLEDTDCTKDKLTRRKCLITSRYAPLPQTKNEKIAIRSLIHEPMLQGQYGEQHLSHIINETPPGNEFNILTKVPKVFTGELIKEIFIQMVIINKYVELFESDPSYARVIPTYGFFMCDQKTRNNNGKPLPRPMYQCHTMDEVFENGPVNIKMDGVHYPFLVQEYISPPVETLRKFVGRATTTLEDVKDILLKIFKSLAYMQEGEYQLTHGDLHSENILIHPTKKIVYIIDWGLASFTFNGLRYPNFLESGYRMPAYKMAENITIERDPHILSGLYDFCFILNHIMGYANRDVGEKIHTIRNYLLTNLFPNMKEITYTLDNVEHTLLRDSHLYPFLFFGEKEFSEKFTINNKMPPNTVRVLIHKEHIDTINGHTYYSIFNDISAIFNDDYLARISKKIDGGKRKRRRITRKRK